MAQPVSLELFAQLWDQYVAAATRYQIAKHAVDRAEAAHESAYQACEAAHAEEVTAGKAVMRASARLHAASDAAFLSQNGIIPELTDRLT